MKTFNYTIAILSLSLLLLPGCETLRGFIGSDPGPIEVVTVAACMQEASQSCVDNNSGNPLAVLQCVEQAANDCVPKDAAMLK